MGDLMKVPDTYKIFFEKYGAGIDLSNLTLPDKFPETEIRLYPAFENGIKKMKIAYTKRLNLINHLDVQLNYFITDDVLICKILNGSAWHGDDPFIEQIGDSNYLVKEVGDHDFYLDRMNSTKKLTKAEIKALEDKINLRVFDPKSVVKPPELIEPERIPTLSDQRIVYPAKDTIEITVDTNTKVYDFLKNICEDAALSDIKYIVHIPYYEEYMTFEIDSSTSFHNTIMESLSKQSDKIKSRSPQYAAEMAEHDRIRSYIYEYKSKIEEVTKHRQFTISDINPGRWTDILKKYGNNDNYEYFLEGLNTWAVAMEDAIDAGYTIDQVAIPYLYALSSEYFKDNHYFERYSAILIKYWKYGEQLKEYTSRVCNAQTGIDTKLIAR